jgi:hypothetical protein
VLDTYPTAAAGTKAASVTVTIKPAPDGTLSRKKSPAAVPDFQFPRSYRANLTDKKNGKAWQDRGDKMAPSSNQLVLP